MIYGALPEVMATVSISPVEMMHWMYCPIWTPRQGLTLPANLVQFLPIVEAACTREGDALTGTYGYLTAKTLWVSGDYIGNRPGWHADGFGTDDVNYIWCDAAPTEFIEDEFEVPDDCADAMALMEERATGARIYTYRPKTLLRLTPQVIHRPPVKFAAGMRSFVKLSISKDRYNLEGNSINHDIAEPWPTVPRQAERNHPVALSRQA